MLYLLWQALTAAHDTLSGDDEGSGAEGGSCRGDHHDHHDHHDPHAKWKMLKPRQSSALSPQDMEDSGNRQCVACGAAARQK